MKTILFQGDSITDTSRAREDEKFYNLGYGYVTMTAGRLAARHPGKYTFLNRGISGNKTVELYARIKRDVINLKPDYMSLLIGVNDVWAELKSQNGITAEKYKKILRMFLSEIKEALPDIKIIILEPFVLRGEKTSEYFEEFYSEVRVRAAVAKEIACEFDLPFVYLQEKMNELAKTVPSSEILYDGVHPNITGNALICEELLRAYEIILD